MIKQLRNNDSLRKMTYFKKLQVRTSGEELNDSGNSLSDAEREQLISDLRKKQRTESRKKIIILVISSLLVGVALTIAIFNIRIH